VAADLRRRTALVSRLKESEASYRLVAEKLGDTIIHTSVDGDVRFASAAIADLTGYAAAEVVGRNSRDFVLAEDMATFAAARDAAIADSERTVAIEYRARVRNDVVIWCETRMRSYVDADDLPAGVILVVRDVTARKAMEAELTLEARTDALTGLPNRRTFFNRLEYVQGEVEAGHAVGCVALLDLDFFKQVNDTHGHSTGDLLLQAVSNILARTVRHGDMVARVGGEEFGLILGGTDIERAVQTCDRVLSAIAGCSILSLTGGEVRATASIGITSIVAGRSSATLYAEADRALYDAKSKGRNQFRIAA
jgi:diguanylate cyclase (GGDEF)-like protein/PAS domain S-box-containing protein